MDPKNNAAPTRVQAPDFELNTTGLDMRNEDSAHAAAGPADIAVSPNENGEGITWDFNSKESQTKQFAYKGHEYRLVLTVGSCMEIPYEPSVTVILDESNSLLKVLKADGSVGWCGEWSLNGSDWFYLFNSDNAPEEDVRYLFTELRENGADPEALQ